jgi:hypothetical protein
MKEIAYSALRGEISLGLLKDPYCVRRGEVLGYWYPGEHLMVNLYKELLEGLRKGEQSYKESLEELERVIKELRSISNI